MRIKILRRPSLLACTGIVLIATAAIAGSGVGGIFNLGQTNTVNSRTLLQGATATQQLYVINSSASASSTAVRGSVTAKAGMHYGIFGTTTSPDGFGGYFQNSTPTNSNGTAVVAVSKGALSDLPNRYGKPAGAFIGYNGVLGVTSPDSTNGFGVIGHTSAPSGSGVRAASTKATGTNYGIWASAASPNGKAGFFQNTQGSAVRGLAAGATADNFPAGSPTGGEFAGPTGITAVSTGGGNAIQAFQGDGAAALFTDGDVILQGYVHVGVLEGFGDLLTVGHDLHVNGTITKGASTFKIDHPLDPENKYLSHSVVESPDMMNIYNGNIVTDAKGTAVVELPEYFEALNRDPRYQLTVIGSFAAAQIAEEVRDNRFIIRTSEPGVKVSWQVTGIRQDAFAREHPVIVQEKKAVADRGHYLHPEAFGKPASLAIGPGLGQVAAN